MTKISADVQIQADKQAAQSNPQPVQTIYKNNTVEKQPIIKLEGDWAVFARAATPHILTEIKRIGGNLIKGGAT